MINWADRHASILNLGCVGVIAVFVVVQFYIDQKIRGWKQSWQSGGQSKPPGQEKDKIAEKAKGSRTILDARKWLSKGLERLRKAG